MEKTRKCSDCHNRTEFKGISQEYERDGIRIVISGIGAFVCPVCGSISFPPGVANKIVKAFDALYALAEERHKGVLTASIISG